MKLNESGEYLVTEDSIFIKDTKTEQKIFFLVDRESKIVLRSMLEDDIKQFVTLMDVSNSEKRKKMRILNEVLPQEGSEELIFVAEKIVGEETNNRWNEIYELERIPIGLGTREGERLQVDLYQKYETESMNTLKLVTQLGQYFGINGKGYIMPYKTK